MWLCMKWHGAGLYGVHRTHQDGSSFMWHQLCQRCKHTTLVNIEMCYINLFTHVESYASAVSAWEWRIALYKSDQQWLVLHEMYHILIFYEKLVNYMMTEAKALPEWLFQLKRLLRTSSWSTFSLTKRKLSPPFIDAIIAHGLHCSSELVLSAGCDYAPQWVLLDLLCWCISLLLVHA